MRDQFFENPAEADLETFDDPSVQVGPNHNRWVDRVKKEMMNIKSYLNYLQGGNHNLWFFLTPIRDKKFNFRVWEGKLKIPQRPDIEFDLVILLPSEYPKVFPRAFVEESIIDYAKKNLYWKSIYEHKDKKYVMICHDHLDDLDVWHPSLSIAHFLLREILVWWNSRIDTIIKSWDENPPI